MSTTMLSTLLILPLGKASNNSVALAEIFMLLRKSMYVAFSVKGGW